MSFGCVCGSARHTTCARHGHITPAMRIRAAQGLNPVPETRDYNRGEEGNSEGSIRVVEVNPEQGRLLWDGWWWPL